MCKISNKTTFSSRKSWSSGPLLSSATPFSILTFTPTQKKKQNAFYLGKLRNCFDFLFYDPNLYITGCHGIISPCTLIIHSYRGENIPK
jgi:hypothetical protein